jgi:hypothetical protein
MKREDVKRENVNDPAGRGWRAGRRRRRERVALGILFTFCVFTFSPFPTPAAAQPTQEEVFRSIGENVNEPVDSGRVLGVLAGIAGVIVLLAVISQRRKRDATPKALHHHGKLLKEVLGSVSIKGAEMKQLKAIVQDGKSRGESGAAESPLTLLLCPSVLVKAVKANPEKVDQPVVAGLVKRMVGR